MAPHNIARDVQAVDDFLLQYKTLTDFPPDWGDPNPGGFYKVTWQIVDQSGISQAGTYLAFTHRPGGSTTMRLIVNGGAVHGVDLDPVHEVHENPIDAHLYGLDDEVVGPHIHRWSDNRNFVLKNGFVDLPYRATAVHKLTNFNRAFAELVSGINLTLTSMQLSFDGPRRLL